VAPGYAAARAHRQHDRLAGGAGAAANGNQSAPKIIFSSHRRAIARELEPRFAAAGCAVISNSSAFRMAPNVPLVLPEVNADHLHLIEEQSWRKESGGYIVTNSNCTVMGPVLALKPLEDRFGIEQIFATSMQAVSGAGYPGVASMDILDNVVPYIGNEEEKMEEETLKLLGKLDGHAVKPLIGAHERQLQPRSGRRRPHGQRLHQAGKAGHHAKRFWPPGRSFVRWPGRDCRPLPSSPSSGRRSRIARSRAWTAIAAMAWP
jgi:N-acetyl-gamma-glutamylphosphate reductase